MVAAGLRCITKLDSSGDIDPGFGLGGSAPLEVGASDDSSGTGYQDDGGWIIDLIELNVGYLVVTNTALIRFRFDGTRDPSFGGDGRVDAIEAVPYDGTIVDAFVAPDGSIFMAGVQGVGGPGGQTVAKLKPGGAIDPSFGTGGVYSSDSLGFGFQEVLVDGTGRILVSGDSDDEYEGINGYGRPNVVVLRLTADGEVDIGFGEDGLATSASLGYAGPISWRLRINGIAAGENGRILVFGGANFSNLKYAEDKTAWALFADDGSPLSVSSYQFPTAAPAFAELSDGDLALADGAGGRINLDGSGGFSNGRALAQLTTQPSPSGFRASSISTNPVTGHLLSTGYLGGATGKACSNEFSTVEFPCWDRRGAVVKIDADSGEPVAAFGSGGVAMTSPNVCDYGKTSAEDSVVSWGRCRIEPPAISARARFRHGASRRPWLRVRMELRRIPAAPQFPKQRLRLRLPDRLRLKRGAGKRLQIKADSKGEGKFSIKRRGRLVTVEFTPTEVNWDPYYEDPPESSPLHVTMTARRGALRPIPRKIRKRKLNFNAWGKFSASTSESIPWWTENPSRKEFKAWPVGIKKTRR